MTRTGGGKHNIAAAIMLTVLSAFSLSSCKGLELENKVEMVEEYTKEQAMIVLANEKNRYENAYSEYIWQIAVDEDGQTFEKLTIDNVRKYLEEIKLLCLLAEERRVTVTSTDRDLIRQTAESYMNSLSEADLSYIGCDTEDVTAVYTDIFQADKLLRSITGTVDTEMSDSEAKVIKIEQIGTADEKKAKAILKRVKIDGADFSSMASRYTETDETELTLLKNDGDAGLIEETAFSLEENEISNILCTGDMYYIIKCTDGYAEDETIERKNSLESAMNNRAVSEILEPYEREHSVRFAESYWDEISFGDDGGSETDSFFELLEDAMPES